LFNRIYGGRDKLRGELYVVGGCKRERLISQPHLVRRSPPGRKWLTGPGGNGLKEERTE
jgi:hypothetical protein